MSTPSILTPFDICQEESIAFLAARFHAACGDAPGGGKTRTGIKAAERVGAINKLVVCPASVRSHWWAQIETVTGHTRGWDVVGYPTASSPWHLLGLRDRYDAVLVDEEHFCKEPGSARAFAVLGSGGLVHRGRYKWCFSGTFAPNGRPVEYWPMLKTLHPHFARMSFGTFARLYCGMYFDGRENNVKGASRVEEFKMLLDQFIVAHTKAQLFPGRREPLVVRVPVELTQDELRMVTDAEMGILSREVYISSAKEAYSQLGDSAALRHLVGLAMTPHAAAFAREKLMGVRKLVLFFQHTEVGAALRLALGGYKPALYRGGMTDAQKDAAKARFLSEDGCRVFLAQQQAAGTGTDGLQRVSSTIILAEPDWVPGETWQRVNRLDRPGAESDLVTAYQLYARGTLHSAVLGVHDRKEKIRVKL